MDFEVIFSWQSYLRMTVKQLTRILITFAISRVCVNPFPRVKLKSARQSRKIEENYQLSVTESCLKQLTFFVSALAI